MTEKKSFLILEVANNLVEEVPCHFRIIRYISIDMLDILSRINRQHLNSAIRNVGTVCYLSLEKIIIYNDVNIPNDIDTKRNRWADF